MERNCRNFNRMLMTSVTRTKKHSKINYIPYYLAKFGCRTSWKQGVRPQASQQKNWDAELLAFSEFGMLNSLLSMSSAATMSSQYILLSRNSAAELIESKEFGISIFLLGSLGPNSLLSGNSAAELSKVIR